MDLLQEGTGGLAVPLFLSSAEKDPEESALPVPLWVLPTPKRGIRQRHESRSSTR